MWLSIVISGFVLWKVGIIIYRYFLHPLSKFPGPFLGSVTTLYRIYWFIRGGEHENLRQLHAKYGPIVRYGPDALFFDDPALVPIVYHTKADKTDLYAANFGSITTFTMMNHKDHVASKQRIANWYASKSVKPFEVNIDNRLEELLKILERNSTERQSVDCLFNMNLYSFDVIGQFCFGHLFGFLQQEKDVNGMIGNLAYTVWYLELLAISESFSWYVRNTRIGRYLFMCRPTDKRGIGAVMAVRDRTLERMLNQDSDTKAQSLQGSLLGGFLTSRNRDGTAMNMDDVKAELLTAIQAGSETTSLNLALILFHVGRDPRVQKRLQEELDSAEQDGRIPTKAEITSYDQAQQLPYLTACVQESLRFSSSNIDMPRCSPQSIELGSYGRTIPPNTSMATSAWIIGRNRDIFGQDADTYRPERWMEASATQRKHMDRYDLTFGYGARMCLGRHLARTQLWKLPAEVFRRFDVRPYQLDDVELSGMPADWNMSFHPRKMTGIMDEKGISN